MFLNYFGTLRHQFCCITMDGTTLSPEERLKEEEMEDHFILYMYIHIVFCNIVQVQTRSRYPEFFLTVVRQRKLFSS